MRKGGIEPRSATLEVDTDHLPNEAAKIIRYEADDIDSPLSK